MSNQKTLSKMYLLSHEPCRSREDCYHARNGHIGGLKGGHKAVESGQLAEARTVLDANPEIRHENGRKAAESGRLAEAAKKGRAVQAAHPEIMREVWSKIGRKVGRKAIESGQLARIAKGVPSTADGILFRSQTEASFYCVTKKLGGKPAYEPIVIVLSDGTSYHPDFILAKPILDLPANVPIELKPSRNAYYNGNLEKAVRAGAIVVYWDELEES